MHSGLDAQQIGTIRAKKRPRGRPAFRQDVQVVEAVERLAGQWAAGTLSIAAVQRGLAEKFPDRAPADRRTVRDLLRQYWPDRDGEPWSLADAVPGEAPLVLRAWAAAVQLAATKPGWWPGQADWPTLAQADWIVRVRQAAPDLPAHWGWWLGCKYAIRTAQGQPTQDLDLMLALRPWAGQADFERFAATLKRTLQWDGVLGGALDGCRMLAEQTGDAPAAIYRQWFEGAPQAPRRRRSSARKEGDQA